MKLNTFDLVIYIGFAMFAANNVLLPMCLPEISSSLSISHAEGGGMETLRAVATLFAVLAAGLLVVRLGKKRSFILGQLLLAAGLLITSVSSNYLSLVLSLAVASIGGGFIEAMINPLVRDAHPEDPGRHFNIVHAFYPIGTVAAALVVGELLTKSMAWPWIFRVMSAGPVIIALCLLALRFPADRDGTASSLGAVGKILGIRRFWLFAFMIFIAGGIESAIVFWIRTYVTAYIQEIPRAGAIALMLFSSSMAAGRIVSSRLAGRMGLSRLVLVSSALGIISSALIPLLGGTATFYFLVIVTGLAVSCLWPTTIAMASQSIHEKPTLVFAMLSSFGLMGFGAIPLWVGVVSELSALKTGFSTIPVFFAAILVMSFVLPGKRRTKR